jgi:cytochrome P450
MISPTLIHHDERIYSNPTSFAPDRWPCISTQDLPKGAYIPFETGDRTCIAENFVWMQATTVLTSIPSRYRLRLLPDHPVHEVIGAVLGPSPVLVTIEPREILTNNV